MSTKQHFDAISELISTVRQDRRDEWPDNGSNYLKGENLCSGYFGIVRFCECRDPVFGFEGLEVRRCVIKTIYLQRRLDSIMSNNNKAAVDDTEEDDVQAKLLRFYRRTVMELFILNRCRHEHLMHAHSVFICDDDLHIVLPRFYVLNHLIEMYRVRKQSEPIPAKIIAKILRQLCHGLDYLQRIGIMHRDVQPENIYITRQGTVKLGHFGQSMTLLNGNGKNSKCKTPVGKEEFMCYEKLNNLYEGKSLDECLLYDYAADIWSLGVLVLNMVAYFPEEKNQKLRNDFALIMNEENMPFIWLTVEMLQLRARLVKSGGEEMKTFISEQLLTVSPEKRATAASLPKTREMQKWCCKTVDEDKKYIRSKFIDEVDFANRYKLEDNAPNYECLETKDIPPDFYWSDLWKKLEQSEFLIMFVYYPKEGCELPKKEYRFKFSEPEPLFKILHGEYLDGRLKLIDIIPLDYEIKELIYELVKEDKAGQQKRENTETLTKTVFLPDILNETPCKVDVKIRYAPIKRHRLLSSGSSSNSDL